MATHLYHHVKVPGFGCTYPNEFQSNAGSCFFELRRLTRGEVFEHTALDALMIIPIEAGRGTINIGKGVRHSVDFERLVLLPKKTPFTLEASSPILKALLMAASSNVVDGAIEEFDLQRQVMERLILEPQSVTRTTWLNEIFHRYAFERSIANQHDSAAARFLETEIIKELYYRLCAHDQRDEVPFFVDLPAPLRRALTHIEQNLLDKLTADDLSASAMTSKATLIRLFRNHLDVSPVKYIWNRRLDEADGLLLTGRYTVSEVSALLGFNDPSSFSKSYFERFGSRPSSRIKPGPA